MKEKLKQERGITGIDIAISIIIITIFVALLATIFFNINANSKGVERKTEATHYAISLIENIKNNGFDKLESFVDTNRKSCFRCRRKAYCIYSKSICDTLC